MTNREEREEDQMRPVFTPRVDLGHLLQAIIMGVAAIAFTVSVSGKADLANQKVDELKLQTANEYKEMKTDLNTGLNGIRLQISNLPDISARVTELEHNYDADQRDRAVEDNRIATVEQRSIENSAQISSIKNASQLQLGPSKR